MIGRKRVNLIGRNGVNLVVDDFYFLLSLNCMGAGRSKWWISGLDQSVLESKLIDRILGTIYGNCLGDAVGLGVVFLCLPK